MNKSGFSGFRDQNPQDVFMTSGIISSNVYAAGEQLVAANVSKLSALQRLILGGVRTEIIEAPAQFFNATCSSPDKFVMGSLTSGSGTTSFTTWSTTDMKTWTQNSSTVGAFNVYLNTDNVVFLWTGSEFLLLMSNSDTFQQYGYYSADLSSWTLFNISSLSLQSFKAVATASYIVIAQTLAANSLCNGITISKPLSASPTISTMSFSPSNMTLAALGLDSDICFIGNSFTTNFVTFKESIANFAYSKTPPAAVKKTYMSFYDGKVLYLTPDGVTWKGLQANNSIPDEFYEVSTSAGTIIINAYEAIHIDSGLAWIYNINNYYEANYSGTPIVVSFKNELYYVMLNSSTRVIRKFHIDDAALGASAVVLTGITTSASWIKTR